MKLLHNSALAVYRKPLGAVRTDETVLLRIRAEGVSGVRIRVFVDDVGTDYDMIYADGFWCHRLTLPEEPKVIWYYFLAESDEGTVFYGPPAGKNQGEGIVYSQHCPSFQMTVYDKDFETPEWFRRSTMYQIFPDRFRRGDPANMHRGKIAHRKRGWKCVLHKNWQDQPLYRPLHGEKFYSPCDFFGGDFRGIINSLGYLKRMGISLIYLNPVVEAASNHRYDTADYMQVDPFLGTNDDLAELCGKAAQMGIHVMLDGVYSHTGADSRYFNKSGCYPGPGAFQGPESPYYSWYHFFEGKEKYKCWWGFESLPEVDETNESWQRFVITGEKSVFSHWLSLGADGFRLDVADELPDDVIALMRGAVKKAGKDKVLLGEVWEDATTKRSYGYPRRYALGQELDSVMNYPFKEAVIAFLLSHIGAPELADFLTAQRLNYPLPMYYALMNLLSSHDVPRVRTVLATGKNGEGMSREEQAALQVTEQQDRSAARLQRLAAVLQFVLPGVPTVYYGDEFGMHGLKDPFNRGPFTENDPAMCYFYRHISSLRRRETVLQTGYMSCLPVGEDVLAILRLTIGGKDAFGQTAGDSVVLTVINRDSEAAAIEIDLNLFATGLPEDVLGLFAGTDFRRAADLESGMRIPVKSRRFPLTVEGVDYVMLTLY